MFRRLLSVIAIAASTALGTISSCGTAATRFQLTALDFQPPNPAPGDEVFMTVEFQNPGSDVTDGKAHRKVTLNGLPVVDETVALCGDATTCPLTTGFNNRSALSTWPDVTGKIVSTIQWLDSTGGELLCIKTSVTTSLATPHVSLRGVRKHTHTHTHDLPTVEEIRHLAQPSPEKIHSTAVVPYYTYNHTHSG